MDTRRLIDSFEEDLIEDLLDCLEKEHSSCKNLFDCLTKGLSDHEDPVLGMISDKRLDLLQIGEYKCIQISHLSEDMRNFLLAGKRIIYRTLVYDIVKILFCKSLYEIGEKSYMIGFLLCEDLVPRVLHIQRTK